jgi:hypothetical protein
MWQHGVGPKNLLLYAAYRPRSIVLIPLRAPTSLANIPVYSAAPTPVLGLIGGIAVLPDPKARFRDTPLAVSVTLFKKFDRVKKII